MSHIPVNHPLRPLYRALAAFVGLFVLLFGVVGYFATKGTPLFSQSNLHWVLGLRTNLGFALTSVAAGAVLLLSTLVGRNLDRFVYTVGGLAFMVVGMLSLGLLRTGQTFS